MNVNADELSVSNSDFAALDDAALLTWRAEVRAELERLPPHSPGHAELTARYDLSTQVVDDRARRAWTANPRKEPTVNDSPAVVSTLPAKAARLLAVEILLAEPETLADDVLESCLYALRERLSEE